MAGFDFKFKSLKTGFFDVEKITRAADAARLKVLSRYGAFVRRTMKNSIKYRAKGVAPPGSPPFAHRSERFTKAKTNKKTGAVTRQTQSPLRELIFFALDRAGGSVVTGPVAFGARGAGALEHGGTTTSVRRGKRVTVRLSPHPFARPAGEAELKTLPELLRNSIN